MGIERAYSDIGLGQLGRRIEALSTADKLRLAAELIHNGGSVKLALTVVAKAAEEMAQLDDAHTDVAAKPGSKP